MKRRKGLKKKSDNIIPRLKAKAWTLFSKYIRQKYADKDGMVICFTCGKKLHWKEAHASHFRHGRLDFDEMNINPCCCKCNTFLHGNLGLYAMKLAEKYGLDKVWELERRANEIHKYSRQELEEIIEKYKEWDK